MIFMKYEICNFAKAGWLVNTADRFAVCRNKERAKQHNVFVMDRKKSARGRAAPLLRFFKTPCLLHL